ncbi:MAG: phosphotransferase family protein, partial [Vicinamibacterales bacterium]
MTERIAAGVVGAQFPELAPVRASYLTEGCDSAAFVVNDTWIFRFPKRRDVEQQLLIEIRVLSWLEERSPLRVPAFRFHGQPSTIFPFGFVGYARIPGDPAIQIARDRIPYDAIAPSVG